MCFCVCVEQGGSLCTQGEFVSCTHVCVCTRLFSWAEEIHTHKGKGNISMTSEHVCNSVFVCVCLLKHARLLECLCTCVPSCICLCIHNTKANVWNIKMCRKPEVRARTLHKMSSCIHFQHSPPNTFIFRRSCCSSSTKLLPTYSPGNCQREPDSPSGTDYC